MPHLLRLKSILLASALAMLALSPAYAKDKFKVITNVYRHRRHGEKRSGRCGGRQFNHEAWRGDPRVSADARRH
ncbi:iron ABC transporter substrate-binding protein [Citrobacter koseri]|uniref:Iron ABC transporter substrate-binding protein n=1 Tax=Citrobacter koseri TaxID=545 RepID=A0A2X2WPE1_CITKO|nr:iron ABC transporter substrate-binding protein [Citrobacter koseri]